MSGCPKYEACDSPTCVQPRPHCIWCAGLPSDHPDEPKPKPSEWWMAL